MKHFHVIYTFDNSNDAHQFKYYMNDFVQLKGKVYICENVEHKNE